MNKDDTLKAFLNLILSHDYSYNYSDDHRAYSRGQDEYKKLQELLEALITEFKYVPETLLADCLATRTEQFTDGLTHRIIRNLFDKYIKEDELPNDVDTGDLLLSTD